MSGATSSGCDTFVFGLSRKLSTQVLRCRRWLPLVDTALVSSAVIRALRLSLRRSRVRSLAESETGPKIITNNRIDLFLLKLQSTFC